MISTKLVLKFALKILSRESAYSLAFTYLISECGGSVAEWLEHRTCNPEAPSSSPALTYGWIGSGESRDQIPGRACK